MRNKPIISRHPAVISREFFSENPHFSSHLSVDHFLKTHNGDLKIQWVHLKAGEEVSLHTHEVDTLMIACKGRCILTGDIESIFEEGDIVLVPKLVQHGLLFYKGELFSGLSLRFEKIRI